MKDKQHEYIIRAFLQTKVPTVIKQERPELVSLDSCFGGYCTQLIKGKKQLKLPDEIISKEEKELFSELINYTHGQEKTELSIYYSLLILLEEILGQYKET